MPWARLAMRAFLSLGLFVGFIWLFAGRLAQIDIAALSAAFAQLQTGQWAVALVFTAASFWAVGRYDAVLHQHLATGISSRMARRAGVCAIAVSQTLGLGLISGAILRWRMLAGASLWQATRLTAAVALSFLAGWAVVTAGVLLALPDAPYRPWAALVLTVAMVLAGLCLWAPRIARLRFRWPNGLTLLRLTGLCALDSLAAAAAFHALIPAEVGLSYTSLLPAFLLALGAGLALGTPGGMGAFEVTLLAHMPQTDQPALLAAILAWRLVYFALPAVLGAATAIAGPSPAPSRAPSRPTSRAPLPARLPTDHLAEAGLTHQGQIQRAMVGGQTWLLGRSNHCLISLLTPMDGQGPDQLDRALRGLRELARSEGRLAISYKANARLAARAARAGQTVRRIGLEAVLNPQNHSLTHARLSGLRRKLRRAESQGVRVTHVKDIGPCLTTLDKIATLWRQSHGAERGFSMGRHSHDYLARQRVYLAWQGNTPIAYVSFHTAPSEWTLDLMRHGPDLPDGTMHSLIEAAIQDARALGLRRLSLAAVPDPTGTGRDRISRLIAAFAPAVVNPGLYQFKSTFAPNWQPRYLIASNPLSMALAGLSLWRLITRPPPLLSQIDRDDAEYGFASDPVAWHIETNR